MLCAWAARHGSSGVGVDISEVFLKAARQRALEVGVEDLVDLIHHDASTYVMDDGAFEMVLADRDSWDRYVASQWRTVDSWLRQYPDDPDAGQIREWIRAGQRSYMSVDRRYLGWGVFVLRAAAPRTPGSR